MIQACSAPWRVLDSPDPDLSHCRALTAHSVAISFSIALTEHFLLGILGVRRTVLVLPSKGTQPTSPLACISPFSRLQLLILISVRHAFQKYLGPVTVLLRAIILDSSEIRGLKTNPISPLGC